MVTGVSKMVIGVVFKRFLEEPLLPEELPPPEEPPLLLEELPLLLERLELLTLLFMKLVRNLTAVLITGVGIPRCLSRTTL